MIKQNFDLAIGLMQDDICRHLAQYIFALVCRHRQCCHSHRQGVVVFYFSLGCTSRHWVPQHGHADNAQSHARAHILSHMATRIRRDFFLFQSLKPQSFSMSSTGNLLHTYITLLLRRITIFNSKLSRKRHFRILRYKRAPGRQRNACGWLKNKCLIAAFGDTDIDVLDRRLIHEHRNPPKYE